MRVSGSHHCCLPSPSASASPSSSSGRTKNTCQINRMPRIFLFWSITIGVTRSEASGAEITTSLLSCELEASVEDFPLMMQQQSPRWCSSLEAFVDIVQAGGLVTSVASSKLFFFGQVGKDKDAFFVCVRTRTANAFPQLFVKQTCQNEVSPVSASPQETKYEACLGLLSRAAS